MTKKNNIINFPTNPFLSKAKQLLKEAQPRMAVAQNEMLLELMERVARLEGLLKKSFINIGYPDFMIDH